MKKETKQNIKEIRDIIVITLISIAMVLSLNNSLQNVFKHKEEPEKTLTNKVKIYKDTLNQKTR